jgi:NitT/TauT family transport system ATP-binding protein
MHYLLEVMGLEDFVHAWPHELSHGMAQRVSLCRALLLKPRLLLLDEPFSALDAITREGLDLFLSEIWSSEPITTMLVTHSLPEAVLLSDRVVVLSARPARVVSEVCIELPRPRRGAVMASEEFSRYERQLRHDLREGAQHEETTIDG